MYATSRRLGLLCICTAVSMLLMSAPCMTTDVFAEELKDFSSFSFIDNTPVDTAQLRGNILIVLFGSIYCKPCVELLPVMRELSERYRDSDVQIILIDIDMGVDQVLQREFVKLHDIQLPYIINALSIARDNKVYMLPTALIVNREGEVVKRIYGFKKTKKFDSHIKKLRPVIKGPKDPEVKEPFAAVVDNQTVRDGKDEGSAAESVHHEHHP